MHPVRHSHSIVVLAVPLFVAFLAPACLGAGTVEQVCDAAKIRAAANKGKAKLTCHAKAMAKGVPTDGACLDKAEEKFLAAFAKADKKGPCEGRPAAQIEQVVDQFMSNVLLSIFCRNSGSACAANGNCCSAQCIGSVCQ